MAKPAPLRQPIARRRGVRGRKMTHCGERRSASTEDRPDYDDYGLDSYLE